MAIGGLFLVAMIWVLVALFLLLWWYEYPCETECSRIDPGIAAIWTGTPLVGGGLICFSTVRAVRNREPLTRAAIFAAGFPAWLAALWVYGNLS